MNREQRRYRFHCFSIRAGCADRADSAANGETLNHFGKGVVKMVFKFAAQTLLNHIQGRMQQCTAFEVLYFVTVREFEADFSFRAYREKCNVAVAPGSGIGGQANGGVDKCIRLLPNAYE